MADANNSDEDISPDDAPASGSGKVRKSPGVALADLGDVEDFGRRGKRDQLYAFQFANGVYKRKEGIISSDGATSMEANLDLGGNRITNLKYPDPDLGKGFGRSRVWEDENLARCAVPAGMIKSTTDAIAHWADRMFEAIIDSLVRVHQVTATIVGTETEEPEWLVVVPLGRKRRLRMAKMPYGKSIYNEKVVLLKLLIGKNYSKHGAQKSVDFSTFRYDLASGVADEIITHPLYATTPEDKRKNLLEDIVLIQGGQIVIIQPDGLKGFYGTHEDEWMYLYHDFNFEEDIDITLIYLEIPTGVYRHKK